MTFLLESVRFAIRVARYVHGEHMGEYNTARNFHWTSVVKATTHARCARVRPALRRTDYMWSVRL
jgi:hypothetical protein